MSCGVGHRQDSDPALLWLCCRLAAVAPTGTLAWEPSCATGVTLKSKKGENKHKRFPWVQLLREPKASKTKLRPLLAQVFCLPEKCLSGGNEGDKTVPSSPLHTCPSLHQSVLLTLFPTLCPEFSCCNWVRASPKKLSFFISIAQIQERSILHIILYSSWQVFSYAGANNSSINDRAWWKITHCEWESAETARNRCGTTNTWDLDISQQTQGPQKWATIRSHQKQPDGFPIEPESMKMELLRRKENPSVVYGRVSFLRRSMNPKAGRKLLPGTDTRRWSRSQMCEGHREKMRIPKHVYQESRKR